MKKDLKAGGRNKKDEGDHGKSLRKEFEVKYNAFQKALNFPARKESTEQINMASGRKKKF